MCTLISASQPAGQLTSPAFEQCATSIGTLEPIQGSIGRDNVQLRAKRVMDIVIALVLILFLSPVFFITFIAVRAGGGPGFFRHKRVGFGGREFDCLKFRTMCVDAERLFESIISENPAARQEWGTTQKLYRDPRVTRVGRVLRSTSIDELPQLFNVLRGEMSLVGPRPVVKSELEKFYQPRGGMATYLSVQPGITGPWQVSGRNATGYETRVTLDIAYAQNITIRGDVSILIRTIGAVLRQRGAC
jgi:exopolysaccharide production protein ExoY